MQESKQDQRAQAMPVRRVVVPVGGSDREFFAQDRAVEFAHALGAPIAAIHVTDRREDEVPADIFRYLERQCERWGVPCQANILGGIDAGHELVEELDAMDLVVIGSRRMGGRFHLSSIAERLIQDTAATVQVVRLDE